MIAWKALGWVLLTVVVVGVISAVAAGFALYSTGREAVTAGAAAIERVAQAPVSPAPGGVALPRVPAHVGPPYGCTPADLAYPPCNSLVP